MPIIKLKENESFDSGLRRFKRSCDRAGVISEVRKREFYEKPTSVRKRKAAAAVKRQAKRSRAGPAGARGSEEILGFLVDLDPGT